MDFFTFNKIAGWILFTLLLALGLNIVSEVIYHAEKPEKPGMMVAVASTGDTAGAEQVVAFSTLLASADADKGMSVFSKCKSCHTANKGGKVKQGPNLYNVVGRPIASASGFNYSTSLSEKAPGTWTFDTLSTFITKPKAFAANTKMTFGGLKSDKKRADLIAYLNTLSDNPLPLPEAEAAGDGASEASTQ